MEWWHWFTIGAGLLVLDIALVNSNYLIWLGLGGMITGLVANAMGDMAIWLEVIVFAGSSSIFLVLWFQVFKPRKDKQVLAKAREQIPGLQASTIRFSNGKGLLRLQRPVGGRDVWEFTCTEQLYAGELLIVSDLNDQGIASATKASAQQRNENSEASTSAQTSSIEQNPA